MSPKVSFLIPAHNYQDYIGPCIESVLNQSEAAWELLIVNDCSTDGTWDLCQDYARRDGRIRSVNLASNRGQYRIINEFSTELSGEYCCVLDADDYLGSDHVERLYHYARSRDLDIAMCLHQLVAGNRRLFLWDYGPGIPNKGSRKDLLESLLWLDYFIVDCGTLVKTSLRRRIYPELPKLPLYAATDDIQALFLARYARSIGVLRKPLYYRNLASAGTWRNKSEAFRLKKVSSALLSLTVIKGVLEELAGSGAGPLPPFSQLPMARNIWAKISESLELLSPAGYREFCRRLEDYFEQQGSLPVSPLRPQDLLREGFTAPQNDIAEPAERKAESAGFPRAERKALCKARLRRLKRFLPKSMLRRYRLQRMR